MGQFFMGVATCRQDTVLSRELIVVTYELSWVNFFRVVADDCFKIIVLLRVVLTSEK